MCLDEGLTEPGHDAGDQGVAHQKGAFGRLDPGDVGETAGKTVECFQFFRCQATQPPVGVFDNMGGARWACTAFAGDDGTGRTVERVREGHRALAEGVRMAIGAHPFDGLGALGRLPAGQRVLVEKEGRRHVRRVAHDVAQGQGLGLSDEVGVVGEFRRFERCAPDLAVHTDAARGEAATALVCGVCLLSGIGVGRQFELVQWGTDLELCRQRLGHGSVLGHPAHRISADGGCQLRVQHSAPVVGLNEDAAALLRMAVIRGIDDPPFHCVAQLLQAREDNREIAPLAARWAGNQPVDVLQHHVLYRSACADPV